VPRRFKPQTSFLLPLPGHRSDTTHSLSYRATLNQSPTPPSYIYTPNHLGLQRLRAVSTVGTSLKLPSSVANRQEDCFRFSPSTHRLCLCLRISVPNETLPHHSLLPRIPSALPTPSPPPRRGERRGKGIDHFHPGYVSFRMLLVFLTEGYKVLDRGFEFFCVVR